MSAQVCRRVVGCEAVHTEVHTELVGVLLRGLPSGLSGCLVGGVNKG